MRTLLNSGNAVFTASGRSAAAHATTIRGALHDRLGLAIQVVAKSSAELGAVVAGNTLRPRDDEHSRLLVAFGQDAGAVKALEALAPLVEAPERLVVGTHAVSLHGAVASCRRHLVSRTGCAL